MRRRLPLAAIFQRNVVFGHLLGGHFRFVRVGRIFHSADRLDLESLSFENWKERWPRSGMHRRLKGVTPAPFCLGADIVIPYGCVLSLPSKKHGGRHPPKRFPAESFPSPCGHVIRPRSSRHPTLKLRR